MKPVPDSKTNRKDTLMSPSRRDILKLSAGTVAAALAASVAGSTPAQTSPPLTEPLSISHILHINVAAVMSDGRMVTLQCFHDPEGRNPEPHGQIGIPDASGDLPANWYDIDPSVPELMSWHNGIYVLGTMMELGYEVTR